MLKTSEKWKLYIALLLIIVACFALWMLKIDEFSAQDVWSDTGTWDLRQVDLSKKYAVLHGGISEYVVGQLLTPAEFDQSSDIVVGKFSGGHNHLTMRMRVLVPGERPYGILFSSNPYADRIFINGQLMQNVGVPGASREEMIPGSTTVYYTVVPQNGAIEVVQQTSNYVHHEFDSGTILTVANVEMASRHYARTTFMSALMIGFCLTLLIIHLLLFLLWSKYLPNLYSGLFCLVYALRQSVTGPKILTILFPGIPWEVVFRIEYIAMPLMGILLFLCIATATPELVPKQATRVFWGAELVVALVFLFGDTTFISSYALIVSHVLLMLAALYLGVRYVIKHKSLHFPRTINLVAYGIFVYAVVRDMLYFEGYRIFPFVEHSLVDYASIVYVLLQTVSTYLGTIGQLRVAWHNEARARFKANVLQKKAQQREAFLSTIPADNLVNRGALTMDTLANRAYMDGVDLLLTPKEFSLLLMLVQHEGELFTTQGLYEQVWKQPATSGTRSLVTIVSSLRKKLDRGEGSYAIASRRGKGYYFEYTPKEDDQTP